MDGQLARAALDRLIAERGENYGALSRLIGRNAAYIQQYIKRGSPRKLDEEDRQTLARYFGVDESVLAGRADSAQPPQPALAPRNRQSVRSAPAMVMIPRLALGASAGGGTLDIEERLAGAIAFDPLWLKSMQLIPDHLSVIQVDGESMAPTLNDGDDIMVDRGDNAARLRDGVYVLRLDDVLMVKRIALSLQPTGGRALSVSSDNPHYPKWVDVNPALVNIVGRVVWAGRRVR